MQKVLILDFDGTMVDTERNVYEVWREWFAAQGHEISIDMWASCIGGVNFNLGFDPFIYIREHGLGDPETVRLQLREIEVARSRELPFNPGIGELIAEATEARIPLGVASSSSLQWVDMHLERLGVREYFASIRTRDHGPGKPDPALYDLACEDLDAHRAESWAIEDSQAGVAAAKGAGLKVLAVPHELTATHDVSPADRIVDTLRGLTLRNLGLVD